MHLDETMHSFPSVLQFTFCRTTEQYEALVSRHGAKPKSPYACAVGTAGGGRLIYVNVEPYLELLTKENPAFNFGVNMTMGIMEEILHILNPSLCEEDINKMVIDHTEKFLGTQIPESFKRVSEQVVKGK